MTKEEAIENLKGCVCGYEVGKDGKPNGNVTADLTQETIDMAIKALEAPPNDNWEGYSKRLWKSAYERGKADAEQRWIPVSERLPEDSGYYLTTTMFSEVYCDYWTENSFNRSEAIIAWMPLPESYKAESEEV